MRRFLTFSATVLMALGLIGGVSAGPGFNNKFSDTTTKVDCNDSDGNKVGDIVYGGPEYMWPPNHKLQAITITATAVDPDDTVTLDTEGTHNEFNEDGTEFNGAGNTEGDVQPPAAAGGPQAHKVVNSHELRSERSGQGDGRVYTLEWQATFTDNDGDDGYGEAVCASMGFDGNEDAFQITVPHDMSCIHWKRSNQGDKKKCQA
jgi:hypothetical protein